MMKIKTTVNGVDIYAEMESITYFLRVGAEEMSYWEVPEQYKAEVAELLRLDNKQALMEKGKPIPLLGQEKRDMLNGKCQEAIEKGFFYMDNFFRARMTPDQLNITLAFARVSVDPAATVEWEAADDTIVVMNAQEFMGFAEAFGVHFTKWQNKVRLEKAQLDLILQEYAEGTLSEEAARQQLEAIEWEED